MRSDVVCYQHCTNIIISHNNDSRHQPENLERRTVTRSEFEIIAPSLSDFYEDNACNIENKGCADIVQSSSNVRIIALNMCDCRPRDADRMNGLKTH